MTKVLLMEYPARKHLPGAICFQETRELKCNSLPAVGQPVLYRIMWFIS